MPNKDEVLAAEIAKIQKLAKENPEIDATALISNLLTKSQEEFLPAKQKTRAYLISLLLPPFGLSYVVRFFWRSEKDAKQTAWTCLALTVFTFLVTWWLASSVFSSPELNGLQNIKPQDIYELTQ